MSLEHEISQVDSERMLVILGAAFSKALDPEECNELDSAITEKYPVLADMNHHLAQIIDTSPLIEEPMPEVYARLANNPETAVTLGACAIVFALYEYMETESMEALLAR